MEVLGGVRRLRRLCKGPLQDEAQTSVECPTSRGAKAVELRADLPRPRSIVSQELTLTIPARNPSASVRKCWRSPKYKGSSSLLQDEMQLFWKKRRSLLVQRLEGPAPTCFSSETQSKDEALKGNIGINSSTYLRPWQACPWG